MKRNLLQAILVIGIFTIFGAVSANAQTDFLGKYKNVETVADEELAKKNESKIIWHLAVKADKTAFLTSVQGKSEENRKGVWTWNKAEKMLTVKFAADKKNPARFTYIFKAERGKLILKKMMTDEGEGETYGERVFEKT